MIGEDEVIKEMDKDKGIRIRWKVVNGVFFLFKVGDGKLNLSIGMRRNFSKGVVEVDE